MENKASKKVLKEVKVRIVPEFRKEADVEKLGRALIAVVEKTVKRKAA